MNKYEKQHNHQNVVLRQKKTEWVLVITIQVLRKYLFIRQLVYTYIYCYFYIQYVKMLCKPLHRLYV